MINLPAGARILLATRPVDFRNYAESPVMWSPPARRLSKQPFIPMVEPNRSA